MGGGGANPNNDFAVANPPSDGISSLSWSPTSNFLVATSWDCDVLCYEVDQYGAAVPKASIKHDAPVLCSAWSADGAAVFSGGCDNQVKKWDLATNQPTQVAGHDAPIRHLAWIQEAGRKCGEPHGRTPPHQQMRLLFQKCTYILPSHAQIAPRFTAPPYRPHSTAATSAFS
jgi:hypothetical protein